MKQQNATAWGWEFQEAKDGKLDGWEGRGVNDKWNFENDEDSKQDCMYNKDTFVKLNVDNTSTFAPSFTWSKLIKSKDGNQDVKMKWNDSLPVYWRYKLSDVEKKGSFKGLFLDDPQNPTLSGATYLLAAASFSTAFILATLS